MRAADLITTRAAERRVLVLKTGLRTQPTYNSLYAGLQVIMPGEIARSHRHTPSALRFIVEGMAHTPRWRANAPAMGRRFRRHAQLGLADTVTPARAVVWMDGWTRHSPVFWRIFREESPPRAILSRAGKMRRRIMTRTCCRSMSDTTGFTSPLLRYPYERTREALAHLARGDACIRHTASGCATRIPPTADIRLRRWRLHAMAAQGFFRPEYRTLMAPYSTWPRVAGSTILEKSIRICAA